jgi:putative oxidoreductase
MVARTSTLPCRLSFDALSAHHGLALLALRSLTGTFLLHGVWDNVTSAERMDEFVEFVARHGFAPAAVWAPVSVYAQLAIGTCLFLGVQTRAAALLCAGHFLVAWLFVHLQDPFRAAWPALALIAIGLVLATGGAGCASVDAWLRRDRARAEGDVR